MISTRGALAGIVDPPLQLLGGGDRLEIPAQPPPDRPLRPPPAQNVMRTKEALRDRIVELVHLDEVEAPGRPGKTSDRRGSAHGGLGQLAVST